jgi:hypothetical protein
MKEIEKEKKGKKTQWASQPEPTGPPCSPTDRAFGQGRNNQFP